MVFDCAIYPLGLLVQYGELIYIPDVVASADSHRLLCGGEC
ncbi:hypothetical protein [Leeia speluncae]|nr:hypothetical protein [Leeia speluncae]